MVFMMKHNAWGLQKAFGKKQKMKNMAIILQWWP
jgi:hypothetical protein